jgi:hypothetical protein
VAADPISWLVLEPGHPVVTEDGRDFGLVEKVECDTVADIFDGLLVRRGALADTKYVPAELVGSIDTEAVRLTITADETEALEAIKPPGAIESDLQ